MPLVLRGHSSEVSAVSWSRNNLSSCVTLSDDGTMHIWRRGLNDKTAEKGALVGYCERPHREIGENQDIFSISFVNLSEIPLSSSSTTSDSNSRLVVDGDDS